jgi:phosphoglycolate phosphatase
LDKVNSRGVVPRIYSDVQDVLSYLKERKIKMAVVSSHPTQNLLKEIKNYGLTQYFSSVVGSSKDKTKDLKQVSDGFKIDPHLGLHIEDTIWGLRAAKEAGFNSAGVLTGYHSRERLCSETDIILETLSDLKKIIP